MSLAALPANPHQLPVCRAIRRLRHQRLPSGRPPGIGYLSGVECHMPAITEKKMFGGLCFLLNGNMICGVHKDGGMARVGKDLEAEALQWEGVEPLSFTGLRMGGMVEMDATAIENDQIREAVLVLAKSFVGSLPAK